jgi:GDP-L-fucose synthase
MKKILVTGGNGFLGKHLKEKFKKAKAVNIIYPTSKEVDLLRQDAVMDLFKRERPDSVLHMAAICGGIGANKESPADFVHLNSKMTCNIFDAVLEYGTESLYTLGSVCSYAKHCPVPFKEEDLWNGYPEETNAPYGIAKRLQLVMQQSFMKQYGLKGAHLIPVNMYGTHDHFDLEKSHVIPALIRKFAEAKANGDSNVTCWGTGSATREFLYAGDAAEAISYAVLSNFSNPEPINLGVGHDISIKDLATKISDIIGYEGETIWDTTKPDGQPKRMLDVSRAEELLGFKASTSFDDGLRKTIEWYMYDQVG